MIFRLSQVGYGLVPLRVQVVQSYDSYPQVNVTATKRGLIEHGVLNQNKHCITFIQYRLKVQFLHLIS